MILLKSSLDRKLQLSRESGENAVPDVRAAVQEMMTNLFITIVNHADDEGRCYADSFQELPTFVEDAPNADGDRRTKYKCTVATLFSQI